MTVFYFLYRVLVCVICLMLWLYEIIARNRTGLPSRARMR